MTHHNPDDFAVYTWSRAGTEDCEFAFYAPMVNCRRTAIDAARIVIEDLLVLPRGRRAVRFHAIDEAGHAPGENWYEHDGRSFVDAAIDGPDGTRSIMWMRAFWKELQRLAGDEADMIVDRIILDHERYFRPYVWGTEFFEGEDRTTLFDELTQLSTGREIIMNALVSFVNECPTLGAINISPHWDELLDAQYASRLLDTVFAIDSRQLMDSGSENGSALISALTRYYRAMDYRIMQAIVMECPIPVAVSNYNDRNLPEFASPGFGARPRSRLGKHLPAFTVGDESSPSTYIFRAAQTNLGFNAHPMWQWTMLRINEMMICKNITPWVQLIRQSDQGHFTDGLPHVYAPIIMAMHALGCRTAFLFNPDHGTYDCAHETRLTLAAIDTLRRSATPIRPDQRVPRTLYADSIRLGDETINRSDLETMYQVEETQLDQDRPRSIYDTWDEPVSMAYDEELATT